MADIGEKRLRPITYFFRPISHHAQNMKTNDKMRALAAIELADALIVDFNNPRSALKGIGGETMEKLLVYLKMTERSQRRRSKALTKASNEGVADSEDVADSEGVADSEDVADDSDP